MGALIVLKGMGYTPAVKGTLRNRIGLWLKFAHLITHYGPAWELYNFLPHLTYATVLTC